jgi:hypothetical protein
VKIRKREGGREGEVHRKKERRKFILYPLINAMRIIYSS